MNPFCWWQLVFGVGAAFGVLGIACIVRYILYTRMANHAEEIVRHIEIFFDDYRVDASDPLDMQTLFSCRNLACRIRKHVESVNTLAKWLQFRDQIALWLIRRGKVLADQIDFGEEPRMLDIIRQKAATRKDFVDRVEPELRPRLSAVSRASEVFRDYATKAAIWAAVSFAMGSLVVGLFTLWPVGC